LLVAFDKWSFSARDPRRRRWASNMAQQAGGDTAGWRGRVRDPAIWKDEATLFKVIQIASFVEQSVALLRAIELHTAVRHERLDALGLVGGELILPIQCSTITRP
jgi:hypothetical protein